MTRSRREAIEGVLFFLILTAGAVITLIGITS